MENTFIIFNPATDDTEPYAVVFQNSEDIIVCTDVSQIDESLNRIEKAVSEGYFAAGFLSYELGYHFLDIPFKHKSDFPLICFGIFNSVKKLSLPKLLNIMSTQTEPYSFNISRGSFSTPQEEYLQNIKTIKTHLENGNTYQVNNTFRYNFNFAGSILKLFLDLHQSQPVPYGSIVDFGKWNILSLSPELFFQLSDNKMLVRPMKGTIARGATPEEDLANRETLAASSKDRAENIMIVDLLRNDLGKISVPGSVKPEGIFTIEEYNTLFQMTSTITSELKKDISWKEIFTGMFPSGSVTGAPKKRTMEIIQQIENDPRDIYTGSIGYITPSKQALFNVSIRTILIDKDSSKGTLGIGSGVVHDSNPEKEYEECLLKGSFLTKFENSSNFSLIETMLWEDGDYFLLKEHMNRLEKSSKHLGFNFNSKNILKALNDKTDSFDADEKYRVRLLLSRNGEITVQSAPADPLPEEPVKITISTRKIDRYNSLFQHKTSNRSLYNDEFKKCKDEGYFEVLFSNRAGEITEGAISNVIIKVSDRYYTSPPTCGLLPGVYREYLLKNDSFPLEEKALHLEDLENADEIYITNSVMKMVKACL
jgi:para-aminobenzoate synthetase / 4-amino-4-deoxychorismate lyase